LVVPVELDECCPVVSDCGRCVLGFVETTNELSGLLLVVAVGQGDVWLERVRFGDGLGAYCVGNGFTNDRANASVQSVPAERDSAM
jgi:hypothetical protein